MQATAQKLAIIIKRLSLSLSPSSFHCPQLLKRKEREYEHEMERLAKEKIASQNRILVLKRELTQMGDIDVSRLAPDTDITPNPTNGGTVVPPNGLQMERGKRQGEREHTEEKKRFATRGTEEQQQTSSCFRQK